MPLPTPTFAYPGALAGAWRVVASVWLALVAAVLARWALAWLEVDPLAGLVGSIAGGALVALAAARALPRGVRVLRLHEERWTLSALTSLGDAGSTTVTGRPALALDLGRWLLVRFDADTDAVAPGAPARRLWLPLSSTADPAAWPALRAALWTWRPGAPLPAAPAGAPTR